MVAVEKRENVGKKWPEPEVKYAYPLAYINELPDFVLYKYVHLSFVQKFLSGPAFVSQ